MEEFIGSSFQFGPLSNQYDFDIDLSNGLDEFDYYGDLEL
jgi:hypothetical protein